MLLVKKPFHKKGAIPWEAIRDCLGLHEDQPMSQSEDAEAGESGVVQEGQEVQGGVPHSVAMVGMKVRIGKKRKAMLDEPGLETDTQEDEPAPETDETQRMPKTSKVWKPKPAKKTGRIIKSRAIISNSEEGGQEESKATRAGMVQVKEEPMDVIMVGPISSILDDTQSPQGELGPSHSRRAQDSSNHAAPVIRLMFPAS